MRKTKRGRERWHRYVWLVVIVFAIGCRHRIVCYYPETSTASPAQKSSVREPRSYLFHTAFASVSDSDGGVNVSADKVEVITKTRIENGTMSSSSALPWKPQEGWAVLAEFFSGDSNRVWMFDGGKGLFLHETVPVSENNSKATWYTAANLPCAVPEKFFALLSVEMRSRVRREKPSAER